MGDKDARKEYRKARDEMNEIAKRDRYHSDDYNKAEKRFMEAEKNVSKTYRFFSN